MPALQDCLVRASILVNIGIFTVKGINLLQYYSLEPSYWPQLLLYYYVRFEIMGSGNLWVSYSPANVLLLVLLLFSYYCVRYFGNCVTRNMGECVRLRTKLFISYLDEQHISLLF